MKIDNHVSFPADDKPLAAEQRQVKQQKYIGQLKPHPGHKVFQFSLATGEITVAKVEVVSASMRSSSDKPGTGIIHRKVIQQPNCLYASALNAKNAIKKFAKMYDRLVKAGHIIRNQ